MKKSIKMLSMAMSAVVLAGSLGGCAKKEESDVTVVTIWSGNSHSKDVVTASYEEWNNTVGKEKGIKVEYTVQGGDNFTKTLELALQNGTAPDILGGGDLTKLAENGDIVALDDIPGGKEFYQPYVDAGEIIEGRGMYKGKVYQITGGPSPQGMVYNKDMFKAAGIVDENGEAKPPKTWSEIREYAKILTNADKGEYGIIAPLKWTGWFNSDITNPAMTLTGYVSFNPKSEKHEVSHWKTPMETWMGMKEDGSIYPGADSLDNDSARAMFAEGKIGMKFAYHFDVGVLNDQFPAKCDWGVCAYPIGEDGTAYKNRMDYGLSAFINAHSKVDPEILLEVLKIGNSREHQKKMYEACVSMPYDTSVIAEADSSNIKTGWKEFSELTAYGAMQPREPKMEMAGMEGAEEIFKNHIWTGEVSIDEGLKMIEKNLNKAVENYYSVHTDEDINDRINKDWEPIKQ